MGSRPSTGVPELGVRGRGRWSDGGTQGSETIHRASHLRRSERTPGTRRPSPWQSARAGPPARNAPLVARADNPPAVPVASLDQARSQARDAGDHETRQATHVRPLARARGLVSHARRIRGRKSREGPSASRSGGRKRRRGRLGRSLSGGDGRFGPIGGRTHERTCTEEQYVARPDFSMRPASQTDKTPARLLPAPQSRARWRPSRSAVPETR